MAMLASVLVVQLSSKEKNGFDDREVSKPFGAVLKRLHSLLVKTNLVKNNTIACKPTLKLASIGLESERNRFAISKNIKGLAVQLTRSCVKPFLLSKNLLRIYFKFLEAAKPEIN
jgi:hypothetical protein